MKPAIYHVKFTSSLRDFGDGLAVFKDGSINGGDHGYLYLGTYEVDGSTVTAKLKVKRWNSSVTSVFGNIDEFALELKGSVTGDGDSFSAQGAIPQMQQMTITIDGRKLADAV